MLTFQLFHQQVHHLAGNSLMAVRSVGPNIDNVSVANAIGKDTSFADNCVIN